MSEMVERVAKAIYESHGFKRPWDKARLVGWEESTLIVARAAIESMREPTESMIKAGVDDHCSYDVTPVEFSSGWRAAIDEALK